MVLGRIAPPAALRTPASGTVRTPAPPIPPADAGRVSANMPVFYIVAAVVIAGYIAFVVRAFKRGTLSSKLTGPTTSGSRRRWGAH